MDTGFLGHRKPPGEHKIEIKGKRKRREPREKVKEQKRQTLKRRGMGVRKWRWRMGNTGEGMEERGIEGEEERGIEGKRNEIQAEGKGLEGRGKLRREVRDWKRKVLMRELR